MRKVMISAVGLMLVAGMAMAQGFGLQVGESAAPAQQGLMRATAGFNMGDDYSYYGARGAFAAVEGLLVFADVGMVMPDEDAIDNAMSVQAGALYALPLQLPVDTAVRATVAKPFFDDVNGMDVSVFGWTAMGIVSKDIDQVAGLTVYGGAGLAYTSTEVGQYDESDTELALAGGGLFKVTDQLSVFGEVSYIDDPFFGGGVRFDI